MTGESNFYRDPLDAAFGESEAATPAREPAYRAAGGIWAAWRAWRRARPFWGGLMLALAGLEMMSLPLLSLLAHGTPRVVIYIGVGGISGVVIGGPPCPRRASGGGAYSLPPCRGTR